MAMAREDDRFDDLIDELPPREVTLSTSTILGIFFALALICAAFFGFGYSVGRKSASTAAPSSSSTPVPDAYKPPAGSPAIQPVPGYLTPQQAADANKSGDDNQIYAPPRASTPVNTSAPSRTAASSTSQPAANTAAPQPRPAPVTAVINNPPAQPAAPVVQAPPPAAAPTATSSYVQIAAFSRQDDADLVLKALRTRGYAVNAQTGADHLIHLQMGPYSNRKDADAMRQRLIADGYNAIVK